MKIFRRQVSEGLYRPVSTSVNSAARPSNGLSGHAQLKIQAESGHILHGKMSWMHPGYKLL